MKSKVRFDLNEDNRSVIFAEFENSEDVRDKIAMRFRENLGYDSNIAICRCIEEPPMAGTVYSPGFKRMEIKTVKFEEWIDSLTDDEVKFLLSSFEAKANRQTAKEPVS